jgi:O-antigen/teichoic acid export membrane protein
MIKKRIAPLFFKNSFYSFFSFGINHIGGIIFTILIARILNPDAFGMYSLALSTTVILMILGDLGLGEASVRYVSLNFKNKSKAKSYFLYLLKIKIFVLLSLSSILIISSKLIASFYNKEQLSYLLIIGGFYLFFYSLMQFISALFYAFKNIKADIYKEFIFQASRICLIPLLLIFSFGYLAAGPIILVIISSIITIIFLIVYLFKRYNEFFTPKKVAIDKKEIFHFIKYLSLSSLSIIFLVYTDILILGKFVDLEFVGFYRTAAFVAVTFASFLTLTAVLYPIFAQLNQKKIKGIFDILLYYLFIFSIPMAFGVFILSRQIIQVLFVPSYLPAATILLGLSLLIIILPAGELFIALLNSKGKSKLTGRIMFYASLLNVVLNLILIYLSLRFLKEPIYAALGVGIATVISRFFIFFSLAIISKKEFNIKIKSSFITKPIIASCVMIIFLFLFTRFIYGGINFILIICEGIIAFVIYFIILFLIKGISNKDITYLYKIIKEMKIIK